MTKQYHTNIERLLEEKVFPVYTAEYYDPNISPYFMTPQQEEAPVVDGIPMTHEEYKALHPDYEIPRQWTPRPVYQTFDLNMSRSFHCTRELIDMCNTDVPFRFENREDMAESVGIAESFMMLLMSYRDKMDVQGFIEAVSNYIHVVKTTRDTLVKRDLKQENVDKKSFTVSDFISFL